MNKKIILRLFLLIAFSFTLHSCVHDEINSSSDPSSKQYTNKSLWKEDEVYIKNVMKVYFEHETEIKKTSGTPSWDYATTMDHFNESFLMVPVVESGRVVSVLKVPRHGKKVYFIYTSSQDEINFFQNLIFSKIKKALITETSNETNKLSCITKSISVWLPDSESNPDGSGQWSTHHITTCTSQDMDTCLGVIGPDGQCSGGDGSGNGGYDYGGGDNNPDPEQQEDPCQKGQASITAANTVFKNGNVKIKMDVVLKGKVSATKEWAVAVQQAPNNGSIQVTAPKEGGGSSSTPPLYDLPNPSYAIATAHSHAGAFGRPSGGDLYSLLENRVNFPNLQFGYVYGLTPNGTTEIYVLTIDDPASASQFLTDHPKIKNYNPVTHDINDKSEIGRVFDAMKNIYSYSNPTGMISGEYFDRSAIAMAYMLEQFNSGISIAKVDGNGNFKKINAAVQKITKPNGIVDQKPIISKCP